MRPGHEQTVSVLCYWWPSSRSFTGEPCAELHLLGSLPLAECLIEACVRAGASHAKRGDFTLRSFLAGKLDLTQAEAVLAVISAESKIELEAALGQLAGNLSQPVRELRDQLLGLCARLEAGLDFVEEDIEFIETAELLTDLRVILSQLEEIQNSLLTRGGRSRLPSVVLMGLPNAGKSSLLNALTDQDRAIISSEAGTTRDAIECTVSWDGQQLRLVDTAGMEELTENTPRALAQSVLESRVAEADLVLLCYDRSNPPATDWMKEQCRRLESLAACMVVGTKSDLAFGKGIALGQDERQEVSALTGSGIEELKSSVLARLAALKDVRKSDALHHTMLRCRDAIERAMTRIEDAIQAAELSVGEEIVASDLRVAIDELSFVIGEVHTEEILGEIFSRFCIGK
ncbi:MAG: GTPase [Planctomycetota bacterium]